jgi:hypothetical protein
VSSVPATSPARRIRAASLRAMECFTHSAAIDSLQSRMLDFVPASSMMRFKNKRRVNNVPAFQSISHAADVEALPHRKGYGRSGDGRSSFRFTRQGIRRRRQPPHRAQGAPWPRWRSRRRGDLTGGSGRSGAAAIAHPSSAQMPGESDLERPRVRVPHGLGAVQSRGRSRLLQ